MLIAGEATTGSETLVAHDPTTGGELARFPHASDDEVDRAVEAARHAVDKGPWSTWAPRKRAACMRRLAALCDEKLKDLARVEMLDAGIPRMFATKLSAKALVRNLEYYASWADKSTGQVIAAGSDAMHLTLREPVGVIAAIFPWNVPLLFVGSKLGPSLAAGNSVILKPSELASLSALRVASLVTEAGFPPGVIQVLTGSGATGDRLVRHPDVDKVSFTGGRDTARLIQRAAGDGLKPVVFELGGKSPNIVFADADLNKATLMSTFGVFGLTGQACAAGSRLLVHADVHDQLVEGIATFSRSMGIGDPLDPATLLGPLISGDRHRRVQEMIETARQEGAVAKASAPVPDKVAGAGHFIGPHLFTEVSPDMALWRDEVFGPVLAVTPFDTEDEALALANDTAFGLAAGVWTNNLSRARRMASRLDAGIVWVNTYGSLPVDLPFGGFKQSGWGKEGGQDALADYTRVKSVILEG